METEVWVGKVTRSLPQVEEAGALNTAWARGILIKYRIDPVQRMSMIYGLDRPWRTLCVGLQGSSEYRPGDKHGQPSAVYPTWTYGDRIELLHDMLKNPAGESKKHCSADVPPDERPVYGQEHRVVLFGFPNASDPAVRRMIAEISELQNHYPDAIMHFHTPAAGFSTLFGMPWRAVSFARHSAEAFHANIILPNGKRINYRWAYKYANWVHAVGMEPVSLEDPKTRVIFNIKSALWAGKHYKDRVKMRKTSNRHTVDISSPDADYMPDQGKSPLLNLSPRGIDGDMFLCDACSLSDVCSYFRRGAVCTLPGAETTDLAKYFGSSSADSIILGLSQLVKRNAERLELAYLAEEATIQKNGVNKEVTQLANQVFDQGMKLAKLYNPNLNGNSKVSIAVSGPGSQASITASSPRALVASVVAELESQGIPREKITDELIMKTLQAMEQPEEAQRAIEGTVLSSESERP